MLLKRFYITATRYSKWTVTYFDGNKGWKNGGNSIFFSKGSGWGTQKLTLLDCNRIDDKTKKREYLGL